MALDRADADLIVDAFRRANENSGMTRGGGGSSGSNGGLGALTTAATAATSGLAKLATGAASSANILSGATDFIKQFGTVGFLAGNAISTFGNIILDVNNTMRETGRVGVTFNGNMGEYNAAVMQGQLTMPEFSRLLKDSTSSMAGFGGGMDNATRGFLGVLTEIQGTEVALNLKAAGMQSQEFAEILAIIGTSMSGANMKDEKTRQMAVVSTTLLADEMNRIAQITGRSRQAQERALDQQMKAVEIQASIDLRGPEFGVKMAAGMTAMGDYGASMQRLLTEEATGGARTEESLKLKATLGPAADAVQAYARAINEGNPAQIAEAKARMQSAVDQRIGSQEFLKTTALMGDRALSYGTLYAEAAPKQKALLAEQAEIAQARGVQLASISKDEAAASLAAKATAAAAGLKQGEDGKPVVDPGSAFSRTLNLVDNQLKVSGGVLAGTFTGMNESIGLTIRSIDGLSEKFKQYSTPEGMLGLGTNVVNKGNALVRSSMADLKAPKPVTPAPGSTESEVTQVKADVSTTAGVDLLTQLNNKMGQLVDYASETAESSNKQVRATKSLSNNRLE